MPAGNNMVDQPNDFFEGRTESEIDYNEPYEPEDINEPE